ncbi:MULTISPECIES: methenyltetrahydromethanopterin cyclohydrolase [Halococcus]|uniref:Methenyltetrahydromethanopterin cyclohydrolase n=1 Tax=Halococcus salifodinae DSM 8989 TaxID=1227456 RepID=M0MW38_9EURY|nr:MULTISPECIES: methenyltetrahydromethanopterin cyclohydrolase [Halococcus]EMA49962.1 N(5),N(10)-methenyltetrahydromethanopterin cyclohydrolase [Halococcus salifodinae DSM 8989]
MESLNRMALELVEEAIEFADELAIEITELDNGATVLDFGHDVAGGIEAGLLLAEIQTAGLATIQNRLGEVAGAPVPHIDCTTDRPALALLCAQKAGWELALDGFEGLASGPGRALLAEEEIFARVGYEDDFDFATLAIEADDLPGEAVAERIADRTDIGANAVFLPSFPSASLVGSVTAAARAAELATVRLADLGYDPLDIRSVSANAPVAPVAGEEATAIALANDALAYGGQVHLTVDEEFDRFDELTSTASDEYGAPFEAILDGVDWNFAELSDGLFAPAQVTVDVSGGPTHAFGATNEDVLGDAFGL